jgi:pyrrolidone-carboxylate peptidase
MNKTQRILVYGFGPYRQFRENITAKIVRSLPAAPGVRRVVFRVRFHRAQFVEALERHQPDAVLGLGQSSRGTIEFETRAANRRRAGKKAKVRAILERGPRWLPTTLDLKFGPAVKRSTNAGDYVCNFSMYVMLDQIQRAAAKTQVGFIHVPHDFALHEATRIVAGALRKLTKTSVGAKTKPGSKAGAPSPT